MKWLKVLESWLVPSRERLEKYIKEHYGVDYPLANRLYESNRKELEEAISVLCTALSHMSEGIEYTSSYNAFLLGQITEKEFEQESEKYVRSASVRPYSEILVLRRTIELLFKYGPKRTWTASDIADLFNVTDEDAERALELHAKYYAEKSAADMVG